ncbi:MAG: tetratricopeptide repeat protein [Nitrospirae bacterium]|nr:MAG: tetratricopeptide repeat protein [Nitrospirota bacterium]
MRDWMIPLGMGMCCLIMAGTSCVKATHVQEPQLCSPTRERLPFCAPADASPVAQAAFEKGNQFFSIGRWDRAREEYERAIQAQPDLGEAHYNLALTLQRLGADRQVVRKHYIDAANLEPGNKKIWNSPVLRRYGDVLVEPKANTSPSMVPGLGGIGGIGGLGGGS